MDPAPGTKVSDRITLLEPLASGAMGAVWIAEHETLQTRVAVKLLPRKTRKALASAEERFALEASAAARITSPHVVRVFDHGVTPDGTMFIVMELLSGESLAERMKREGQLALDDTIAIVEQSAKALGAAHAQGLVHRDIKPGNIFLTEEHGELFVKVLDFGVVKRVEPGAPALSEPGLLLGTPAYMSRDLILQQGGEAQPSVDLWSLSVVAYRCLTGRLPFRAEASGGLLQAIIAAKHDPPRAFRRGLDPAVDGWFARAFDLDPERRFRDAGELAASFRSVLSATAEAAPRAPRAGGIVAWVFALLSLLGLGYGALRWSAPPEPEPETAASSIVTPLPAALPSAATPPAPEPTAPAPDPAARLAAAREAEELAKQARRGEVVVVGGAVVLGETRATVAAFFLDRTEVTLRAFAACTLAGACSDRRLQGPTVEEPRVPRSSRCNWQQVGREDHPMNCVSFAQAESYCRWRGARLPTEAEWVRAARGDGRRAFVWGDELASCERAVMADADGEGCGRKSSWKIGTRPEDVSPFAALDLAGNLSEWTSSFDPAASTERIVKGGSWAESDPAALRIEARFSLPPTERSSRVGFRCARSAR